MQQPMLSPMQSPSQMFGGMVANPYAMYASQAGQNPQAGNATGVEAMDPAQMMSPMMFFSPPMMGGGMGSNQFAGMYMTPYGMMAVTPMTVPMNGFGGSSNGMDQYGAGFGLMNPAMMMQGGMPYMMAGGYGQMPMMPTMMGGSGGMSMTDVIQLMMLLKDDKPQRRFRLFQRLAERREARRERKAADDPLNMLMQAWTTPYMQPGTALRMPARNAYPYGFFGAQVGAQETANYGGVYDLYMGNTTYQGLY